MSICLFKNCTVADICQTRNVFVYVCVTMCLCVCVCVLALNIFIDDMKMKFMTLEESWGRA